MSSERPSDHLLQALERYQMALPADQVERLERYCQLLWQWNQRLNLTRHTDYDKFVTRDLTDSLELAKLLTSGERILDVGTGGGVPGVVLGILRDDLQMSVCESVGKKADAVEDIIERLDLPIAVYKARAEDLVDDFQFHTLVSRAVGPLWKMCKWFAGHWTSFGQLLVIKGPRWMEERQEARHRGLLRGVELRKAHQYQSPGIEAHNVILKLWAKRPEL